MLILSFEAEAYSTMQRVTEEKKIISIIKEKRYSKNKIKNISIHT